MPSAGMSRSGARCGVIFEVSGQTLRGAGGGGHKRRRTAPSHGPAVGCAGKRPRWLSMVVMAAPSASRSTGKSSLLTSAGGVFRLGAGDCCSGLPAPLHVRSLPLRLASSRSPVTLSPRCGWSAIPPCQLDSNTDAAQCSWLLAGVRPLNSVRAGVRLVTARAARRCGTPDSLRAYTEIGTVLQ